MKTYEFTFIVVGKGETEQDCLNDALDAFMADPGDPTNTELLEDEE